MGDYYMPGYGIGYGTWMPSLVWMLISLVITGLTEDAPSKHRPPVPFTGEVPHLETLSWALKLDFQEPGLTPKDKHTVADFVALELGLINEGQIGELEDHYLFSHHHHAYNKSNKHFVGQGSHIDPVHHMTQHGNVHIYKDLSTSQFESIKREIHRLLDGHGNIQWHSQQIVRGRHKRTNHFRDAVNRLRRRHKRNLRFQDPAFPKQWHLHNFARQQMDVNISGVWEKNITGRGVTVAVVDDGIEWTNPDLKDNYSPEGSWDLNDNDADPMPSSIKAKNHHGTRCAGEIAAVANSHCGVGVAYQAKIAGIKVLDGPMTDSMEATAFNKRMQTNDIYSCSWGPGDDGKTVDGPHYLAKLAMQHGVDYGRKGYGAVYVVASGNGGRFGDNCNFDGYANSMYTITIGAVDEQGAMPYYAEQCASMLAVTFSSGNGYHRSIVTTDWLQSGGTGCTESHTGTSAAAPLAAGMIALMLEARPCLTWRDVQYIIVMTAVKVDIDLAHWHKNAAGLHHSHKHGFGLMNAWRMVNAAKVWRPLPWLTSYVSHEMKDAKPIPPSPEKLLVTYTVTEKELYSYGLNTLEYVQVRVTLTHEHRGTLEIRLQCPTQTESVVAAPRPLDESSAGFTDWTFSTVRCWGEKPDGVWRLIISDTAASDHSRGQLLKWQLRLYGSPLTSAQVQERMKTIEDAISGRYLHPNYTLPCPAPLVQTSNIVPISDKVLKILVLASAFCIFMAVYETFEYAFCYNEEKREHSRFMKLAAKAKRLARVDQPSEVTRLLDAEEIPLSTFTATYMEPLALSNNQVQEISTNTVQGFIFSSDQTSETPKTHHNNSVNISQGACSLCEGEPGCSNIERVLIHKDNTNSTQGCSQSPGNGVDSESHSAQSKAMLRDLNVTDIPQEILDTLSPEEIKLNLKFAEDR